MELRLAKALDHLQPGAPRFAAVDFDRAGDQHLADPAAAGGHDDWVVLGSEPDDRLVGLDHACSPENRGAEEKKTRFRRRAFGRRARSYLARFTIFAASAR